MDKYNFKEAMIAIKEQKEKNKKQYNIDDPNNESKYIRNSEVIQQKIKENKKEDKIFKTFEDYDKAREEWNVRRNAKLNVEKSGIQKDFDNKIEILNKQQENQKTIEGIIEMPVEGISALEIPQEFGIKVSNKEFVVTVNPQEAIKEINEQNENKRIVNVDKYTSDFKCLELYNWFHMMFQEWEKEMDRLPPHVKLSPDGRERLGIYKQCRGYIKPLLRLLKRKQVSNEIMNKLFEVMIFCIDRDYIRAHDKYIELAIGNAPWPMGVTMVGIHERSGRSKIYKSQVAHILNDENTKKYLQSVKRIMSLVQRLYPTSPSNQVVS